jgi:predicted amidophosphoribosyltransferase
MEDLQDLRCPVCGARFRSTRHCSRCGVDLSPLMALCAAAWQTRESARQAILEGEFGTAFRLASKAQDVQDTPTGRRLRLIAAWLAAYGRSGDQESLPFPDTCGGNAPEPYKSP